MRGTGLRCALPPRITDVLSLLRFKEAVPSHEHFIQRALELAVRGTGCTSPNPLVGSVVVHNGRIIGEGWHEVYGEAHAEVNALNDARRFIQSDEFYSSSDKTGDEHIAQTFSECTLYVTLEPCNHHGYTPPCTHAIVNAGIKHVVYALEDPNPKAAGGADWLRQQGVSIVTGVLEDKARHVNRFFLKYVADKLPFVIAKTATSLDGRIATRTGHSQWITGPAARQRGHQLRQAVDAIIVGSGTVLSDDPSLTVRLPEDLCAAELVRHPRPVILDTAGRVPLTSKLLNGSLATKALIITTKAMSEEHREALESHGHEVAVVGQNRNGPGTCPVDTLAVLGERKLHSVLLEGGAMVHGTFRDAGLIDEVWSFIAPSVIGGQTAPSSFAATGSDTLEHASELHDVQVEHVGNDVLIRGLVSPSSSPDAAQRTTEQLTNFKS
ncbi:MAG: bifunctional diaminohydroxyphosphoribosylaminopyrimidine deaminase/5-amino-6-(5-phosphoribosylamino)uracil reductase RibD [Granulosicoccus sp.]